MKGRYGRCVHLGSVVEKHRDARRIEDTVTAEFGERLKRLRPVSVVRKDEVDGADDYVAGADGMADMFAEDLLGDGAAHRRPLQAVCVLCSVDRVQYFAYDDRNHSPALIMSADTPQKVGTA
ncbi:hypothetical protein MAGR_18170 [Mycolicibacterium agri]|uniref:Uncharacterized protein n=1 Tax=Mycolicibacterium agri TaxID=36811 RepID=A0A7I9VZE0_MYCAG|nr:hypothetical protein MAGR_18170 [Mycolicibacterium agri]